MIDELIDGCIRGGADDEMKLTIRARGLDERSAPFA
jgi:hypothetical protein